jgi:Predicted membrane protein (DUF2306)
VCRGHPEDELEQAPRPDRGTIIILGIPIVISLWFVNTYAITYLLMDSESFGIYRPRHDWLYAHVVSGIVALFAGPVQLWLGANRRISKVHHILGLFYVSGVAIAGVAGLYLAMHTDFGWVFGAGFAAGCLFWLISTLFAVIAIARRMPVEHREWMIRSYVLTSTFVIFRAITAILQMAEVGTIVERMSFAGWISWSIPFVITECILTGRGLFARKATVHTRQVSGEPTPVEVLSESQNGAA